MPATKVRTATSKAIAAVPVVPVDARPMPSLKDLVPVNDLLVGELGMSRAAARKWIFHSGARLRAWRVGKGWRTTRCEVEDWLRRMTALYGPEGAPTEAARTPGE